MTLFCVLSNDLVSKHDDVESKIYDMSDIISNYIINRAKMQLTIDGAHSSLNDTVEYKISAGKTYRIYIENDNNVKLEHCVIHGYNITNESTTSINLNNYSTNEIIYWYPTGNATNIGFGAYAGHALAPNVTIIIEEDGSIIKNINDLKLEPTLLVEIPRTIASGLTSGTNINLNSYISLINKYESFVIELLAEEVMTSFSLNIDGNSTIIQPNNKYEFKTCESSLSIWISFANYVKIDQDGEQVSKGGNIIIKLYSPPAVSTKALQNSSITTEKLSDSCITNEKLSDSCITNEKIANDSITLNKLNNDIKNLIEPESKTIPFDTSFLETNLVSYLHDLSYLCPSDNLSWKSKYSGETFDVSPNEDIFIYTGKVYTIGYTFLYITYLDSNGETVTTQQCAFSDHLSPKKDSYLKFNKQVPNDNTIVSAYINGYLVSNGGMNPPSTAGETYYISWIKVFKGKAKFTNEVTFDPPYIDIGVNKIVNKLISKLSLGNIITFGFATDCHIYNENQTNAVMRGMKALAKITKKFPYDFICLGGDNCHEGAYNNSLNELLREVIAVQEPLTEAACPVISITGNHDAFQNNNSMTGEMLFNAHFKRIANSGFLNGWDYFHTNGYWDAQAYKIRFIFYDDSPRSDYDATARETALTSMLSTTPNDFKIIIFSHHVLNATLADSHFVNPMQYQTLLSQYANKIICCICGHMHADVSETKDGILYIATTMAKFGQDVDGNTRTIDTEAETAFDTFVIDQENKHIYAFRYGFGIDRDWSYSFD